MTDRVEQAISFLDRLTWNKLLMTTLTAVVALLIAYSWEHREVVVPAVIGSTIATIGVSVSLALVAIGVGGNVLLARMDRKGDQLDSLLRDRITQGDKERDLMRQEIADGKDELRAINSREDTCQRELRETQRQLRHVQKQLIKMGGDPMPSEWGNL